MYQVPDFITKFNGNDDTYLNLYQVPDQSTLSISDLVKLLHLEMKGGKP